MAKNRILVIEDEQDIRELIEYNLIKRGFEVVSAADGEAGLELAQKNTYDLVLLDIMLPGLDGLTVCKEIRKLESFNLTPIIMLTAKSEEMDIVVGLELGADDYITKPFSTNELHARIRAHIRRKDLFKSTDEKKQREIVEYNGITIDLKKHEVLFQGNKIQFTLAEFKLLEALISDPGRVFTRDQLVNVIAGEDTFLVGRNIDVHVRSIRKKLGEENEIIETIRGVGYKCKA